MEKFHGTSKAIKAIDGIKATWISKRYGVSNFILHLTQLNLRQKIYSRLREKNYISLC